MLLCMGAGSIGSVAAQVRELAEAAQAIATQASTTQTHTHQEPA